MNPSEKINHSKKNQFEKISADKKIKNNPHKFMPKQEEKTATIISKESIFDSEKIPEDAKKILEDFDKIIQSVRPMNSRQLQSLPQDIRNLSAQMTSDRSERRLGYMNETVQLSAYARYFVWWNLVRQVRLFSNMSENCFPENDAICLDIGSGPLTVVTALWLARPELRSKKLTWYCLDVSQNTLKLGEDIFLSVAAKTLSTSSAMTSSVTPADSATSAWKIIRVKGNFGEHINQKANFITCANTLNEFEENSKMPPEYNAKKILDEIKKYSAKDTKYFFIEPGVPKSARTLSLLRTRFLNENYEVVAPCPHALGCPMNGFKAYTGSQNKWCNFAFATTGAPKKLLKLSELAKLPKERATLSFVCAVPKLTQEENKQQEKIMLRIASDPFRLPQHKTGFYACSSLGLTLVSTSNEKDFTSGDLITVSVKKNQLQTDEKSGAVKINL